jgi:pyruvate carboxylase
VTPTSKSVGDMALFLVGNNLSSKDVLEGERELAYPESVIDLIGGKMGQPPGGFPEQVKQKILRGQPGLAERPGAILPPVDLQKTGEEVAKFLRRDPSDREIMSYLMYPKVYREFAAHQTEYFDTSVLPTPTFLFGQEPGEEIAVEIEPGKTLIIKYLTQGDVQPDGTRTVFFELNGQPREVTVIDRKLEPTSARNPKADPADPKQVGAGMPGMVVAVAVAVGDVVKKGQKLLSLEAMKMESTLYAEQDGQIAQVLVKPGSQIQAGDLLLSYA